MYRDVTYVLAYRLYCTGNTDFVIPVDQRLMTQVQEMVGLRAQVG